MHYVLVQSISTWWTKASRGMPQSQRRNSVPEVTDVPPWPHEEVAQPGWDEELVRRLHELNPPSLLFNHRLEYNEPKFAQYVGALVKDLSCASKICDCWLRIDEGKVVVELESTEVGHVPQNTWDQFVYNRAERVYVEHGAYRKNGTWADWLETQYCKNVLNVGYFISWDRCVFRSTQPRKVYRRMKELRCV